MSLARISRAHVFAARKVHWTLRLSGSALRIAFSRYALSEKAGRSAHVCSHSPTFVPFLANFGNKLGHIPPRLFPFTRVCSLFGRFGNKLGHIPPRLFPFPHVCSLFGQFGNKSKKKETKARTPPTRYRRSHQTYRLIYRYHQVKINNYLGVRRKNGN